ncbi:hypothetical protein [Actinomycetospora sp. CA-084318]|uniref:hypothetical protein n=1 Tax=Actinomycetospora sp. CA-084318 TaxID=3239892 RepID=UPI003D97A5D8
MSIDWGSVPDWLAGVGAVSALGFAGVAALAAVRSNRAQQLQVESLRAEQRAGSERERRAEATKLALWVEFEEKEPLIFEGLPHSVSSVVRFSNASSLPLYSVSIVMIGPEGAARVPYNVLAPTSVPRVLPRASRVLHTLVEGHDLGELLAAGRVHLACSFRDSSGLWWVRSHDGRLVEARDQADAENLSGDADRG